MDTLQVLKEARDLISDPNHWTTNTSARDASGQKVIFDDPKACQWCAIGAVYKVCGDIGRAEDALDVLEDGANVSRINDMHGHLAVLAVFDKTIQKLQEQQQC